MTVRGATRRESPDGHVLYIEDIRRHLGVRSGAGKSDALPDTPKTRPEVILIGHDMHGDFRNMERDDIDLRRTFNYSGCLDTAAILEDTDACIGKSLSSLVSHYDLAKLEWKVPASNKVPGKYAFVGSHCAGNDAIKNLEAGLAQALDLTVNTPGHKSMDEPKLPNDWLDKSLQAMNTSMILLAYDTESVEIPKYKPNVPNRTSEHGFAWLRIADIANIAPGHNACNWRPFIHARHWINSDFRNFKNRFYCVGNPLGFWPEYGKSQYYRVREGPAVFHRMFEEIANFPAGSVKEDESIGGVAALLEKTTLVGSSADNQNDLDTERNHPFSRDIPLRGTGDFRGNPGRGHGGHLNNNGGTRGNRGNSADNQNDLDSEGNHPLSRAIPLRGRGGFRGNPGRGNRRRINNSGGTLGSRGNSAGGRGNPSANRGRSRGNWRGQ